MSTVSCTIGGVAVSVKNGSFSIEQNLENRSILSFTVEDSTGVANYTRGQQVVFTDSVQGVLYRGYINSSQPSRLGIASGWVEHSITCMDKQYLLDKRTNNKNYLGWYAGNIAMDFIDSTLASEGVTAPYATNRDTTTADFNTGTNSGLAGYSSLIADGDLELAKAGVDLTITETTTADFSTGTLTSVQAINNSLTPTTQNALSVSVTLPGGGANTFLSLKIWSGSMTIGTSDTLNYDVWIASSSPNATVAIDFICSDGTVLSTLTTILDQNSLLAKPTTDLSSYASNAWYTRQMTLTGLNGKTINSVLVYFAGISPGAYQAYFKNVYLGSQTGNKFLSTTATVTNVSPPKVYQFSGYLASSVLTSIVTVFDPNSSNRLSLSHSIDAIQLLRGSIISWNEIAPSGSAANIAVSYNGGSSFIPCINNASLPALPAGSNVAGLSLLLQETFSVGTNPTSLPSLLDVSVTLQSAPAATKSDIVTSYLTQTNFNTGTYSNTTSDVSGNLKLASYTRDWNNNLITNQTSFLGSGASQSASGGTYNITSPTATAGSSSGTFGMSRLDFAGSMIDCIIDIDLKLNTVNAEAGVTYRQVYWASGVNNTFGYYAGIISGFGIQIGYGSNSTSDSYTRLILYSTTINSGTTYHLQIAVNGTHHQVYFNNGSTPVIDIIDVTYQQAGNIGLRGYNFNTSNSATATFDNFALTQSTLGTWTSPSVSISSLGNADNSVITWTETNTSNPVIAYDVVETSVDGGSTWQQATNGASIPSLTLPASVSGKSIQARVTLGTQTNLVPMVSDLVWRVLGAYPGSSGTRSTSPIGNDMSITRTVGSGWGTAFDSQTWVQVGTGTTAVASNKETIANTTGDVHMILGSRTWTDEDGTCRFSLSTSTISAGIELRYVDSNNFYRLQISTTTITILKKVSGATTTLATVSMTLSTGVLYRARFRIVGSSPVALYGNVWTDGIIENTVWSLTATD